MSLSSSLARHLNPEKHVQAMLSCHIMTMAVLMAFRRNNMPEKFNGHLLGKTGSAS